MEINHDPVDLDAATAELQAIEERRDALAASLTQERDALQKRMRAVKAALARLSRRTPASDQELRLSRSGFPCGESGRLVRVVVDEPGISTRDLMTEVSAPTKTHTYKNLRRLEADGWLRSETTEGKGSPQQWYPTDRARELCTP